jgi:DNA-binding MarR family transcriptional regulator
MVNRAREFVDMLEVLRDNISIRDSILKICPDLTKIDCFLLQFLYNTKGNVVMNDLAGILNVSHSRVTRLMDNLCKLNLVKRKHSEGDRRQWYAVLTLEGEYRTKLISYSIIENKKKVLELIPKEKLDEMLEYLVIYTKAFEKITKKTNGEGEINDC